MNATVRLARAEFRKLFTTLAVPVTVALAAVFAVGSVLIDAAVAGKPGQHPLGSAAETYQMLKFGPIVVVAMLILGILVAGGEFRHRTIVPTLLATPRRAQVFTVKVAVIALFGAVFSAVIFGLGLGTIAGVLAAHGMHTLPAAAGRMYVGTVIAGVCFGMIGVALGALTRNTFVAIIAAVGWALFVEVIALGNVAPSLAKVVPGVGVDRPDQPARAQCPGTRGRRAGAGRIRGGHARGGQPDHDPPRRWLTSPPWKAHAQAPNRRRGGSPARPPPRRHGGHHAATVSDGETCVSPLRMACVRLGA